MRRGEAPPGTDGGSWADRASGLVKRATAVMRPHQTTGQAAGEGQASNYTPGAPSTGQQPGRPNNAHAAASAPTGRASGRPRKTVTDLIAELEERVSALNERLLKVEEELVRLKIEYSATRPGSSSRAHYRTRVGQALRQKRTLEKRIESATNQIYRLTLIADDQAAKSINVDQVETLKDYRATKDVSLEELMTDSEAARERLQMHMYRTRELEQVLSAPLNPDDAELEEQLERELAEMPQSQAANTSAPVPDENPSTAAERERAIQLELLASAPSVPTISPPSFPPRSQGPHDPSPGP